MPIITIGIDLAKNIFAVHGVNENGRAELLKPKVSRDQLLPLIANLPPWRLGVGAGGGRQRWVLSVTTLRSFSQLSSRAKPDRSLLTTLDLILPCYFAED